MTVEELLRELQTDKPCTANVRLNVDETVPVLVDKDLLSGQLEHLDPNDSVEAVIRDGYIRLIG